MTTKRKAPRGRKCTACSHKARKVIDSAIVGGGSIRHISAHFGLTPSALSRHAREHLPAKLTKAHKAREATEADALLSEVTAIKANMLSLFALHVKDRPGVAIQATGTQLKALELLAKIQGRIEERLRLSGSVQTGGLMEASRAVRYLREHYPKAWEGLRAFAEGEADD